MALFEGHVNVVVVLFTCELTSDSKKISNEEIFARRDVVGEERHRAASRDYRQGFTF